jgi:YrbI family 3-deoxy-D-manno-octulosonate 8-phosphate phosphatase
LKKLAVSSLLNLSSDELGTLLKPVKKKPNCYRILKFFNDSKTISHILIVTDSPEVLKKLSFFKLKKLHIVLVKQLAHSNDILTNVNRIVGDLLSEKKYSGLLPLYFNLLASSEAIPIKSQKNQMRLPKIILSDVDGVLTDAGMYYSENGDELKKFCTYDGMGFKLFQAKGVKVGILTAENRNLNRNRAKKLKLDFEFHGIENKFEVLQKLIGKLGISLQDVAFVGDDINDIEVLQNVGHAFCPANAVPEVYSIKGIKMLNTSGGNGVIREIYRHYFSK